MAAVDPKKPDPDKLGKGQEKKIEEKDWLRQFRSYWPILLLLFLGWILFLKPTEEPIPSISYTRFKQELLADNVESLVSVKEELSGEFKQSIFIEPKVAETEDAKETKVEEPMEVKEFKTRLPAFGDENLTEQIMAHNVEYTSEGDDMEMFLFILLNLLPWLLIIGIIILMVRGASRQVGGMMSVGRSGAKKFEKERSAVSFDDVAGLEESKEALKEVIAFLKSPEQFRDLGCRVPKGVLLVGPPGTGKTLLARAVAGEAEATFFSITGSDFMEMFVGVGASRVRDLFRTAKLNPPCIIFVDELDSIGRHRGAGLGGGHDEREQTLNQLLSEIDGFEPTENLVVMAATNRPDILDPALLRPGRFDRRIMVDLPSLRERVQILKVHSRKVPLSSDVDMEDIAKSMPGRSGAELSNLVNEAALVAARKGKKKVGREEFSLARDQILMGQPRGGIILEGREKHAVAVHEAGHALVAHLLPDADPVEKISIIPRGRSLGATQQLPEERYNYTFDYLSSTLKVMLGGRASEEMILTTISTGAGDDLGRATKLARRMVAQWGMSDKFKHLAYEEEDREVFLGEQIGRRREYSEQTAREIDEEVKKLIDECYITTVEILKDNKDHLENLANLLEDRETLEGKELKKALANEFDEQVSPDADQPGIDPHKPAIQ